MIIGELILPDNIKELQKAFFIQYQNAENKFYISYVNKNLKTDEDYFPSTFVLKLFKIINSFL